MDNNKNAIDERQNNSKHIINNTAISKKEILKLSNKNGLSFDKCNSYGLDYSNTLRIWRNDFQKKWDIISKQGFDETFRRMWNFYLSYCEAGFKAKNIDLIQFSMNKN